MQKVTRAKFWMLVCTLAVLSAVLSVRAQDQKAGTSQAQTKNGTHPTSALKTHEQPVDPSQYVGAETCKTCHEQVSASYDKGPHWKTTLVKHQGPQYQGC